MKKEGNSLKIIVIVLSIILLILMGFTFYVSVRALQNSQRPHIEVPVAQEQALAFSDDTQVLFLEEPILANVGNRLIVKAVVGLEVNTKNKETKAFMKTFENKQIVIRNEIIELFRKENPSNMLEQNAQEEMGEKIKNCINELLGQEMITDVYFNEFFVQS